LQLPDAPDRPVLLDAFLHQPNHHVAAQRRATFCLYLDLASQTQGFPLTEDSFRRLLYFGATGDGASFGPRPAVADTHRRWRLYQAREYYVFALNALWYYLCDWGLDQGGDVRPIPLVVLWQHLDAALDFDGLADLLKLPRLGLTGASSLASLLDWLQQLVGAAGDSFDGACTIAAPLHEHRLYDRAMTQRRTALADPRIMVAGMVVMLCLIYLRFGSPEQWLTPQWSVARMGADERLSVDGFLRAVRARLRAGSVTVAQLARWLYEDYVIRQHQLVALSKLPENTFRFQRDGDRLRFYRFDNDLGFADARFEALSTALHELGLCGRFEWAHHALTPDGQRLLEEGDLA
jgi:hypothetical protein